MARKLTETERLRRAVKRQTAAKLAAVTQRKTARKIAA